MDPESERLLQDGAPTLEAAHEALRQNQQRLAAELNIAERLQNIATQLISTRGTPELFERILDALSAILHADFASIQMFYPERGIHGELRLLGHRAFSKEAAQRWEWVRLTTQTSCGEALRTRQRVVAPDIRRCDFMAGSDDLEGYLSLGIKAAQSTPLVSRSGALVGMVSTYWREPHEPAASELSALDVLARMAADLIERARAEEALAENQQHLASIYNTVRDVIFHLAVEPQAQFRFVSVNETFLRVTGLSREMVVGKTVSQVIPEPSLTIVLDKYRQAIEKKSTVIWEETSDYPAGRLTGEVSVAPVFDDKGMCTHLVGSVHDITERRRSEQRFHALLEAAPDAMVVADREGKIVLTNAQVETLFGYKRDELLGKNVELLMPERFRAHHVGHRGNFFEEPKVREMGVGLELYGLHQHGTEFPVEVSLSPLETESGTLVISAIRDIAERKRTETALRQSEQRLALAQNAAQLGVWNHDLRTNVITICGKYAQIHGLSPDRTTVTCEEWLSLVHPEDREVISALRREARERTHTFAAEFRIVWPDGSTHWVSAKGTVLGDDSGRPSRSMGVLSDITDRRLGDIKLRESEERFRRVFEEGPLGIALVARDGRFLNINNALCQMLGYSEEEFLQKTFADITQLDDLHAEMELIDRLFRSEIPFYRMEKRYLKKTGEIIWINLTSSLLRRREGDSLQRLTMIEDITEIKRSQEQAVLRQKLESLGTLAGGVAHDFNNLLGAVMAQAELAQVDVAAGASPKRELKAIRDVAMRGSEIVRELMIYAGTESKGLEMVDVSQVIKDLLELLKISVSKHAKLETELGQNLPSIAATAAQISQIVMNLATNASDALGDRDGVIQITTGSVMVGHGSREIEGLAEGEYVQLEVSDTGCGMSPETQARVFDPFFSTKSGGRGLGLAMVHGIVKGLGGAINLVSEPGRGTTFQILLPCAGTTLSASDRRAADIGQPAPQSQAGVVLVVEDEDLLRQAVSMMLAKRGFSVIEARNGSAALDAIRCRQNPIHVLFLDITIPGASAREVLQEARRLRPEMKVIVTSAYPEEMAATSLQSSIEHFIRKPYRVHDVVRLIDSTEPAGRLH